MRPTFLFCGDIQPHDNHQHQNGPDNYYYICSGVGRAAISGADIKPGMTILLTPGGKPFRVDGVEPFNKSENVFVLTSGVPHSETGKFAYGDRWYCLLGGGA